MIVSFSDLRKEEPIPCITETLKAFFTLVRKSGLVHRFAQKPSRS
jgi:hypothetical protein